ncbi:hypothetical protein GCM10010260_81580 [Streptomyces filipinensis]|uniref:Uncharacterized protein n=1 Tax=Streptomyces filipinensis TaxID=66887 RepID=A0A918IJS2_9ACTN|nr:hypothetical protein [Streptomyces filipinensis]GGV28729.1 hypothetical protein GCM10010260_81580 [Streptomyces filipinensis]
MARDKLRDWVGLYGGALPGARVTLSYEDSDVVLDAWTDQR